MRKEKSPSLNSQNTNIATTKKQHHSTPFMFCFRAPPITVSMLKDKKRTFNDDTWGEWRRKTGEGEAAK